MPPAQFAVQGGGGHAGKPVARLHRTAAREGVGVTRVEQRPREQRVEIGRQHCLPRSFQSVSARARGILESTAAAGVRVDDDFVLGLGVEIGKRDAMIVGDTPLDADLDSRRTRRLEREVEAGSSVAVGQLDEGRRLEAAARACVQVQLGQDAKRDPRHRARVGKGGPAAVVRVAGRDEEIPRVERDAGVAQAGARRPPVREAPVGLGKDIAAGDAVVLVALERADGAAGVEEALAPLLHFFLLDAGRHIERAPREHALVQPEKIPAAE